MNKESIEPRALRYNAIIQTKQKHLHNDGHITREYLCVVLESEFARSFTVLRGACLLMYLSQMVLRQDTLSHSVEAFNIEPDY